MSEIRPFAREDVPAVASLYEQVARSGSRTPAPGLAAYFERTFFDHPWFDPEIPSLVYVDDDGRIAGFLGSSVRRLLFDGRPVRMAVSGPLVADPSVRRRAAGVFLLRELLSGPQELTITDGATDDVRRIWQQLGGETAPLQSLGWLRALRPWRAGAGALESRAPRLARVARPIASTLDFLTVPALRSWVGVPEPLGASEELTPAGLVEQVARLDGRLRLRPAYDEAFARWLFDELEAVRSRGELVRRLVRNGDGTVAGWFVYYASPNGIGWVLQIAGSDQSLEAVLDHLLLDAASRQVAALRGRLEPHLCAPLTRRHCVLRQSDAFALLHAPSIELLHVVSSGRALLTRLEGEWWMGHHVESFDSSAAGADQAPA